MSQTPRAAPQTLDEWHDAVEKAKACGSAGQRGVTVRELVGIIGSNESSVRRALRKMIDAGTVVLGRGRTSTTIAGQDKPVPSYLFVKQEKVPSGKKRKATTKKRDANRRRS